MNLCEHITNCSKCDKTICSYCVEDCSGCQTETCKNCYKDHQSICIICKDKLCPTELVGELCPVCDMKNGV